jgi:acid phosphatase type 7
MKNYALLFAFVGLALSMSGQSALFPYLQTPTPHSVWVTWKTSSGVQSLVEFGTSANNLDQSIEGTHEVLSDVGYPANYFYHSVQLTNLQPNTKYYYKITTGNQTSAICNFKTFPLAGQAATPDGHLRFLIMGDNQLKEPRFDSLVAAAKRNMYEKWGGDPCDNVSFTMMVGDQVDVGTLDHYEFVHFDKNKALSPYLPIMTIVGNHETYGTLQMNGYYKHFHLNNMPYQGINSGTENYYAFQLGNVLFVCTSTEHTSVTQFNWVKQVVNAANTDPTVDWIITMGHRPYQAEQYVGDISTWIRNTVVPWCEANTSKYLMHIGAHHHLYARGQLRNSPVYHVLSGGTAWDQYWGMSNETDFDDVQKTIANWMYQMVDIDVLNGKVDVESYSIGGIYQQKNNQLMDSFHRYKNRPAPQKPSLLNEFPADVQLPVTLQSSPFISTANELLNSTQFQVSQDASFAVTELDKLRDYENLFGAAGAPDTTLDLNLGVNILELSLLNNSIPNGQHFARVRHRDRNLEWSPWSDVVSFTVSGSVTGQPELTLNKAAYELTETITAEYSNGPGIATDWVGLYKKGDTPGQVSSTLWKYVTGPTGVLTFTGLPTAGEYFAAFFTNDGYTEIAPRVPFYAGPIPVLASNSQHYTLSDSVKINYLNAPGFALDWIGIYKIGHTPGQIGSTQYKYTSGAMGQRIFTGLPKGYYFANYFIKDGYTEIGQRIFFSVGDTITNLMLDQSIYNLGEYITATWSDAPGIIKDWLGIYKEGDDPNVVPLSRYTYFGGLPEGSTTLTDTLLPDLPGEYFMVMFTNDSYNEVSNRVYFSVVDSISAVDTPIEIDASLTLYPNPTGTNQQTVLKSKYPIDKVELLNEKGQIVFYSKNVHTQQFSFITQDLPPGVYFVRVYARKIFTCKLLIAP